MPSLDQPPQLPAPLLQEVLPSVLHLIAQIDPWVIYQLKITIRSDVHCENQLYGTINTLHGSIFPLRSGSWPFRKRAMDADEVDKDLGNVSFGSTGAFHESRHLCMLVPFINSFLHLVLLNVIKMRDDDGFGHPKLSPTSYL